MVDEDVAAPDLREHVDDVRVGVQARLRLRRPRPVVQVGAVDRREREEVGQVERPLRAVHVVGVHAQRGHDARRASRPTSSGLDLEPHDVAEPAPVELLLDRLEQVLGRLGDVVVGVARDAERGVLGELHAREQAVEVVGDHVLEGDVARAALERQEPRQHLRHLHAREPLLARGAGRRRTRRATATGSRCTGTAGPGRPRAASAPGRSPARTSRSGAGARRRCTRPASARRCPPPPATAEIDSCRFASSSASSARTRSAISCSTSSGARPSLGAVPAEAWSTRPATRTMKNSSRLFA